MIVDTYAVWRKDGGVSSGLVVAYLESGVVARVHLGMLTVVPYAEVRVVPFDPIEQVRAVNAVGTKQVIDAYFYLAELPAHRVTTSDLLRQRMGLAR